MTVDLVIRDGQVVTPRGIIQGGLAIEGERVVAVGADGTLPAARRTIDARGQYVMPGLIDAHVHMGSEEDASIAEGLAQNMPGETDGALHGGVTTLAHFVGQRNEPLVPNIETTVHEGNRWSRVDYFLHAIVSTDGHHAELKGSPGSGAPRTRACCCARCVSAPSAGCPVSVSCTARTSTSSPCWKRN